MQTNMQPKFNNSWKALPKDASFGKPGPTVWGNMGIQFTTWIRNYRAIESIQRGN